ncbi:MAG: CoA transferase [Rhizobiaceae bacterium]|nr:CoA transferase [Rhizobiaceae bacterium]MCV0407233.1 CoA transferase [Rhizobiaceae bacterium]
MTHVLAGPFSTYQLALLGADVIRVEHPEGNDIGRVNDPDPIRSAARLGIGFIAQNANKRSIALDLKRKDGCDAFRRIAATCDVVVENFRPGKMASLGLGANVLRELKPELIYCSITGFGQNGPLANRPAYDHIIQGMSGLMSVTGTNEFGPTRVGTPITDYIVGLMAAFAITTALVQRERTGKGAVIDASMLDATLTLMGPVVAEWAIAGRVPGLAGNKPFSRSPFSGCFDTADGKIVVVANTSGQISALACICGLDAVLSDPRIANWKNHPELPGEVTPLLTEVFLTRPALEWERLFAEASIPCCKVRNVPEVLEEEQVRAGNTLLEVSVPDLGETYRLPGIGCRIDGTAGRVTTPPPGHGEHTTEILEEAGYEPDQIENLIDCGAAVAGSQLDRSPRGGTRPRNTEGAN